MHNLGPTRSVGLLVNMSGIPLCNVLLCSLVLLLQSRYGKQESFHMSTRSNHYHLNVGDSVHLECEFHDADYSLFNNPLLWVKSQGDEVTQVNMMRNVNAPFRATGRFEVKFIEQPPRYTLTLAISGVALQDSGNYTCEVRGPHSSVEGTVTHHVYIRALIRALIITTDNTSTEFKQPEPADAPVRSTYSTRINTLSVITLHEGKPSALKCISRGGYPPPDIRLFLERRDITHKFTLAMRTELKGERGLRLMEHTTEQWTNAFIALASDDGAALRCVSTVTGLPSNTTTVLLNVNYASVISCYPASAFIGDRSKFIRCTIQAKPDPTLVYWIIDSNGTKVEDMGVVNEHWMLKDKKSDGSWETHLYINRVQSSHFHAYTLVAENAVGIRTSSVKLIQRFPTTISASTVRHPEVSNQQPGRRVDHPRNIATEPKSTALAIFNILYTLKVLCRALAR